MAISSATLSSSAFYNPALFALQNSSNELATSTARLSSGSRIVNASDDVAAMSIGLRLQSQLSSLKQVSKNAAQGSSLLQVASGGLTQIRDLLDNMNALATQSNSGSLSDTDRAYLQAQFREYLSQVDSIATTTRFNNINLLDGTLSGENKLLSDTAAATKATGTITFTSISNGNTVKLGGATLTAGSDFAIGGDLSTTVTNLVAALNGSTDTRLQGFTFTKSGADAIVIMAKSGGAQGNQFILDKANSTSSFTITYGASTNAANISTLTGGADDGLGYGSTRASGTIGDSLVTAQSQIPAYVNLVLNGSVSNGQLLRIDNGNGSYVDFTFATTASADTDIQIGDTTEETLQNIVETLSQYSGSDDYGVRQLNYAINGNTLTLSGKVPGNLTSLSGSNLAIATTATNISLSSASFGNGSATGVNVSGINNGDFTGTIGGITATYVSSDSITLSTVVGDQTYSATLTDTTPGSATSVRFSSASGGYFTIELASGGAAVGDQDAADVFADRLNAALSGLTFYNERTMSNFEATGDFIGASARIQLQDFRDVRIDGLTLTAPLAEGLDGSIDLTINGTVFRATSGVGGRIGAYESVKFTSVDNANEYVIFTNGATQQDFTGSATSAAFLSGLRAAFGLNTAGSGVNFQVGENAADRLNVVVNNVTVDKLFNGTTPSIALQADAELAQDSIAIASQAVQSALAQVGALQSRFDSVSSNVASTIQGISQAKSNLVDTDIAEESTNLALATLKVNSAIAVIAQAQNIQSGLLGVLQFGGK